ncbi:MAG: nucleotidyltransferase family protein [Nanoarchaeota archaeon]
MKALILSSGLGTRLYPVTKTIPKTLIEVKGKPLLLHILEKLEKSKYVNEIYITYNIRFEAEFTHFLKKFKFKKKVELITDKKISSSSSSIGTINFFVKSKNIREDLLVLAGDSLFNFKIDDFVEFYGQHGQTSIAVYDSKDKSEIAGKYGVVELDKNDKVVGFEEKPISPKTSFVATLCYLLSNYDLHHLHKKDFMENAGELIAHLIDHEDVYGFLFKGKWFDIGTHEDLEKARKEF